MSMTRSMLRRASYVWRNITALILCGFIRLPLRDMEENFLQCGFVAILLEDRLGHFNGSSARQHASAAEENNPAAHPLDLRHVVRGIEDGGAALALHVEQDLFHLRCDLWIEGA